MSREVDGSFYLCSENLWRTRFLASFLCVAWLHGVTPAIAWSQPTAADLVIDLGVNAGPQRHPASGFLLSFSSNGPPDDLVVPLKPQLFRLRLSSAMERAKQMKAKLMMLVSDPYAGQFLRGYADASSQWPGDNGDWTTWEKHCKQLAQEAKQRNLTVIWDIWNEPSLNLFWKRDVEQYYETWKRGVLAIRSIDPDAVITGPAFHAYDREALVAFLKFARANRVLPNILNWHELNRAPQLIEHVADARETMKRMGIHIDRIMLPVIVAADRQFQPGHAVSFMAAVHRANVEAVCHSCWGEQNGELNPMENATNNCENDSLDGLLSFGAKHPRPAWWTFRAYGDLSGTLAAVRPNTRYMDGVATKDNARGCATILLGRFEEDLLQPSKRIDVEVRSVGVLRNAAERRGDNTFRVVVRSIPDQGGQSLEEPRVVLDERVPVRSNALRFSIPDVGADHALWVSVEHDDDPRSLALPLTHRSEQPASEPVTSAHPSAFVFHGKASIETRLKRFFPVTLEAWIKPEPNHKDVFVIGSSSATYQGIGVGLNNGCLRAQYIAGDFGCPAQPPPGEWSHVAAVYGRETTHLYLNGKRVAKGPGSVSKEGEAPVFVIGDIGKDFSGHHFQGHIRSVRISDGARYSQDFTPDTAFERDLSGAPAQAVLIYDASVIRLGEAVDLSGRNNHGLLIGVNTVRLESE